MSTGQMTLLIIGLVLLIGLVVSYKIKVKKIEYKIEKDRNKIQYREIKADEIKHKATLNVVNTKTKGEVRKHYIDNQAEINRSRAEVADKVLNSDSLNTISKGAVDITSALTGASFVDVGSNLLNDTSQVIKKIPVENREQAILGTQTNTTQRQIKAQSFGDNLSKSNVSRQVGNNLTDKSQFIEEDL